MNEVVEQNIVESGYATMTGSPARPSLVPDYAPGDFQVGLLCALVNDAQFFGEYVDVLRSEDFGTEPCRAVYAVAADHFKRTGQLMAPSSLDIAVRENMKNGLVQEIPFIEEHVASVLLRIKTEGAGDVSFYRSRIREFMFRVRYLGECALGLSGGIFTDNETILKSLDRANELKQFLNAGSTNRFPKITLADLEAYQPDPDDFIAGSGWLRRGGGTLLTGGTGLGKSILALQVAISCAGGFSFLGRIRVHRPARVLVIQAENAIDVMKRDVLSLCYNLNADRVLIQQNLVLRHVYGISGKAFTAQFPLWLAEDKPDLVIIDPYQSFAGSVDMNNTQGFLGWMEPIDTAIKKSKCALLLVCHTGKPKGGGQDMNARQMVYMASGTSALANWARSSMELVPAGMELDRFRLTFGKGAEAAAIQSTEPGVIRLVRELYIQHSSSYTAPYWSVADDQTPPGDSEYEVAIREYLAENADAKSRKVADEVGCSQSTAVRIMRKIQRPALSRKA